MQSDDFDEILSNARQLRQAVASIYKDVTGDDLDIEAAIRHYPVVALAITAGVAATAGWYLGHRSAALPPPTIQPVLESDTTPLDRMRSRLPTVSVSPEIASAARGWFSSVVEPKLRENLDNATRSMQERGLSGLLDSAAGMLDSKKEIHLPDPEDDTPDSPPTT